jgi:hypothetical protein
MEDAVASPSVTLLPVVDGATGRGLTDSIVELDDIGTDAK